jgi:hypothetical protein
MPYFEGRDLHITERLWTTVSVLEDVDLEAALDLQRTGGTAFVSPWSAAGGCLVGRPRSGPVCGDELPVQDQER